MRKTITKLEPDTSKQQEIDFLNEITESIPGDAYLKMLFTEDFVGQVTRWIKDDWSCDMAGTLQGYMDENSDLRVEMEANRKRYASEVSELEERVRQLRNHLGIANGTIGELQEAIDDFRDSRYEMSKQYNAEKQEHREQVIRLETQIEQLEMGKEALTLQVLKLKAFMYDLQNENMNLKQALERGEYYND